MKEFRRYTYTEKEIRARMERALFETLLASLDIKYLAEYMSRPSANPLNNSLKDALDYCEVSYIEIPKTFPELVQSFTENWYMFDLISELVNLAETEQDIDFEVVIKGENESKAISKDVLLQHW